MPYLVFGNWPKTATLADTQSQFSFFFESAFFALLGFLVSANRSRITSLEFNKSIDVPVVVNHHWVSNAWESAFSSLSAVGKANGLNTGHIERFGVAAYLTGREDDFLQIFECAFDGDCAEGHCSFGGTACDCGDTKMGRNRGGHFCYNRRFGLVRQ